MREHNRMAPMTMAPCQRCVHHPHTNHNQPCSSSNNISNSGSRRQASRFPIFSSSNNKNNGHRPSNNSPRSHNTSCPATWQSHNISHNRRRLLLITSVCCCALTTLVALYNRGGSSGSSIRMGFFSLLPKGGGRRTPRTSHTPLTTTLPPSTITGGSSSSSSSTSHSHMPPLQPAQPPVPVVVTAAALQTVVTAALWSFFAGDALSAPTHWFYGGLPQIQDVYQTAGITGYTKPVYELPGSILNKSNLSGGGRSTPSSSSSSSTKTIIGHVINHGKQDLWHPSKSIHYHATLAAGENTLEVQLARVLMHSLVATHGTFQPNDFRNAYVTFMTTPNSHNDTYASTCHRMFFANWYYQNRTAKDCPDNDHHNVDTIDGLVLPTITALAVAGNVNGTLEQAAYQAAETVKVTRNSTNLERYASAWGALVYTTVRTAAAALVAKEADTTDTTTITTTTTPTTTMAVHQMARHLQLRPPQIRVHDEITACYLDAAVPALLDTIVKYYNPLQPSDATTTTTTTTTMNRNSNSNSNNNNVVWEALLANANTGGENVHRGSCLGAILGASHALQPTDPKLIQGLYHRDAIQSEIQDFIKALNGHGTSDKE